MINEYYLEERMFRVKENDAYSKLCEIYAGVPQGSILEPILYTIFTSDIPLTKGITTATYADDTAALSSNGDPTQRPLKIYKNTYQSSRNGCTTGGCKLAYKNLIT